MFFGPVAVLLFEKNKAAFTESRGEVKVFAGLADKRKRRELHVLKVSSKLLKRESMTGV